MENQNELEIDLVEVLLYLKKKLLVIILTTILFGAIGFGVSRFVIKPSYTASTRVYVVNKTNDASISNSDLQFSMQVLEDYKVLITGRNVTQEVISKLRLDIKPEELSKKISVTAPSNTRVLQISVTDNDPYLAAKIANSVRTVASKQIKDIMGVDAVNVVYEATAPEEKSSPSNSKNTILASLLGFMLSAGIYVVIFMLDDTIRTEEDVEHYLGLSTLGVIPVSNQLDSSANARSKKKKNRRNKRKK